MFTGYAIRWKVVCLLETFLKCTFKPGKGNLINQKGRKLITRLIEQKSLRRESGVTILRKSFARWQHEFLFFRLEGQVRGSRGGWPATYYRPVAVDNHTHR